MTAVATGVRRRAATPPGRLRLLSVLVVLALVALWATVLGATQTRRHAIDTLAKDSGASFIAAQSLRAELSAADATAARAFLAGGVEPPGQRPAYARSIAAASDRVVDLARAGSPRQPLAVLSAQLPVYTGLVERARANNRLGLAVGGAYLRQASALMRDTILPAADALAATGATDIDHGYRRASSWHQVLLVGAVGAATLAGLVALQVRLFRRTHRILNPPLLAATALTAIILGLTLTAFGVERGRLVESRDHGYVPMTLTAQARVLALRAWGDESLSLVAHGNSVELGEDARAAAARLGYDGRGRRTGTGVLPATVALRGPDGPARAALEPAWRGYQATSLRVGNLVSDVGGFQQAVAVALGEGTTSFTRFDDASEAVFTTSRTRFEARLSAAGEALSRLPLGATVALGLAAALAFVGIQLRINDYR
ncbi:MULTISPECIES: hypothetical protein [unclassified Frankia]